MPLAEKVTRATYVLDNNRDPIDLKEQVDALIPKLRRPSYVPPLRSAFSSLLPCRLMQQIALSWLLQCQYGTNTVSFATGSPLSQLYHLASVSLRSLRTMRL